MNKWAGFPQALISCPFFKKALENGVCKLSVSNS